MSVRLWFIGSGPFAARCLKHMAAELSIERVVTGVPTRAGRGLKERPSHVETAALELGLSFERTGPLSQNERLLEALAAPPDVVFVVDFAQLIREPLLSAPRCGCLNIHPSLLPRWRGAAPIQRTLMNGDNETGVTVFRLVEEMDAGPIVIQKSVTVGPETTSEDLFEILSFYGAQIATYSVKYLLDGASQFQKQNDAVATHAPKMEKREAEVRWAWPVARVHNVVRALNSSTGAFVLTKSGRLKLWRTSLIFASDVPPGSEGRVVRFEEGFPVIACLGGALRLDAVQQEGKRTIGGDEWACGLRLKEGDFL